MGIKTIILVILVLFAICPFSSAMGYSGNSKTVTYQPGLEEEFDFTIITTSGIIRDYGISVEGDLKEYITIYPSNLIEDVEPGANPEVILKLKLPETEPSPGMHEIIVYMSEKPTDNEKQAGIVALSGVRIKLFVNVLYPGKYLISNLKVNDINTGEDIEIQLNLVNYGKERINKVSSEFALFDSKNEKVAETAGESVLLNSDENKEITKKMSSLGLDGGDYKLIAYIDWDESQEEISEDFRIGDMDIEIVNYTKEMTAGAINEFFVDAESKWNGEIDDAYAEIEIGGQTIKTQTYDLSAWETARMSAYVNIPKGEEGIKEANITVYYGEEKKEEQATIVISKGKADINMTMIIIGGMGVIVVLLVGINIMLLARRKDKSEKKGRK